MNASGVLMIKHCQGKAEVPTEKSVSLPLYSTWKGPGHVRFLFSIHIKCMAIFVKNS
jgi:hypothetical protein